MNFSPSCLARRMAVAAPLAIILFAPFLGAQSSNVTRLPDGVPKSPYSVHLLANGAPSTLRWTLTSGALPPGLRLAQNGASVQIEGVPTTFQKTPYVFELRAADDSHEGIQQFSILIKPIPIQIVMVDSSTMNPVSHAASGDADPPATSPDLQSKAKVNLSQQPLAVAPNPPAPSAASPAPQPAAPTLNSIKLDPASASIARGATQQFKATGTYSDSSTQVITPSVSW
jgi:hypothetical protein